MRTDQDRDQQLDKAIAGLPRELLPEQDLWLQLEPRLKPRSNRFPRFGGMSQAFAAAAVVALVGALLWRTVLIPDNNGTLPVAGSGDIEWVVAERVMVEEYESIKAEKLAGVGRVSNDYGDWTYQLAVWDEAIGQVRGALQYYPNEPVLMSQMQGLYQQQLAYLQQISAVDTNEFSGMRNEL